MVTERIKEHSEAVLVQEVARVHHALARTDNMVVLVDHLDVFVIELFGTEHFAEALMPLLEHAATAQVHIHKQNLLARHGKGTGEVSRDKRLAHALYEARYHENFLVVGK